MRWQPPNVVGDTFRNFTPITPIVGDLATFSTYANNSFNEKRGKMLSAAATANFPHEYQ